MTFDVSKINLFTTPKVAPKKTEQPIEPLAFKGGNPESKPTGNDSSYVGVNTNIGVGDTSFISAQVGKSGGIGRTLAFA